MGKKQKKQKNGDSDAKPVDYSGALPSPHEQMLVIEEKIFEAAKDEFFRDMDAVLTQFAKVLDKHHIPIIGKCDIEEWKKIKEAFAQLMFEVMDRAADRSDDDNKDCHRAGSITDYNPKIKFPNSMFEDMRSFAVGKFLENYIPPKPKRDLVLPKSPFSERTNRRLVRVVKTVEIEP